MIRFVEVVNDTIFNPRMERTATPRFSLGEIWINEQHVVKMRAAEGYRQLLREGRLPPDLNSAHHFTAITTSTGSITETHIVVGDLETVARRLSPDTKMLLKG